MILAFTIVAALFCVWASALLEPELNSKQKHHYHASLDHLAAAHEGVPNGQDWLKYYSHLVVAHPDAEAKAWEHALLQGNGPVLVTMDGDDIFATSKIPSGSRLGQRWNLDWRDNRRDAFAFWQIDRSGHKMLRLDVWPEGGLVQEQEPLEQVLTRLR